MMWYGLKLEVLSFQHRSFHRLPKHEARLHDFLKVPPLALVIGFFLILTMRARGASLTKTDGKMGE
jgi:hypothetical protein